MSEAVSRFGTIPWLRRLGWANLVVNVGIVVTGAAVRLTGSGLGCPTWPRCTEDSFTPHGALEFHEAIEFGNRTLTGVLSAVAIAVLLATWPARPDLRRYAAGVLAGVLLQIGVGGITVLTGLNPWTVGVHLLISMAMVGVTVLYLWRIDHPATEVPRRSSTVLAWLAYAAAWIVLAVGTLVTGAGPHAGDAKTERNGLDPLQLSQLHADVVFLLLGLTLALAVVTRSRAAYTLLGVELAQGVVGFVQYATDLPELLVAVHLLGAAVLSAVVTWALLDVREGAALSVGGPAPR